MSKTMDLVVDLELLLDTGETIMAHGLKAYAKELVDGEELSVESFRAPRKMTVVGTSVLYNGIVVGTWRSLFPNTRICMQKGDLLELTYRVTIESRCANHLKKERG